MQDGIDLIDAVARHPDDRAAPGAEAVRVLRQRSRSAGRGAHQRACPTYYSSGFEIAPMVRMLLLSPQFKDPSNYFKRYSWPVEFVVRSLKEVGWNGFSVNSALTPADQHGTAALRAARRQRLGARPGLVLERRHAGADELRRARSRPTSSSTCATQSRGNVDSPESLVSWMLDRLTPPEFAGDAYARCSTTRAPAAPGPDRTRSWRRSPQGSLISSSGSGDYQLV